MFSQSNMLGSSKKPTRARAAACWKCGTWNVSTTKEYGMFVWDMKFHCSKCGYDYWESISDCKDV